MNQHSPIATAPEILRLFRGMDDYTRHKALQLLLREFPYAEDAFDRALADAADELHPDSEYHQDRLYPIGKMTMEASRYHRIELERDVLAAERRSSGMSAMLCARIDALAERRAGL